MTEPNVQVMDEVQIEDVSPKEEVIIVPSIIAVPLPQSFTFPGLDKWPLTYLPTACGANNFYHAVLQSYFTPYMVGNYNGVAATKDDVANAVSSLIYNTLWEPYSNIDKLGTKNYQMVDPTLSGLGSERVALVLDNICRIPYLPTEIIHRKYLWHICHQLNINIYVLDTQRNLCYSSDTSDSRLMRSICVIWKDGFFHTAGLSLDNGGHATFFEKGNEFTGMLELLSKIIVTQQAPLQQVPLQQVFPQS